jgi:hypothetical protein
VYRTGSYFGD